MKRDAGALGFSIFTWAQYLQKYYQKGGDSFQEIHIQFRYKFHQYLKRRVICIRN